MTKEEEEELRAYISRMEADNAFKDAKIRRLEGELRIAIASENQWRDAYESKTCGCE